jgi:hypothetical protein
VGGRGTAAPGSARRRGHEPPAGALPAPVLRLGLCRGLLRLPVGRGARCRRLRGLQGGRRPLRPGRGRPSSALRVRQRQQPGAGRGLCRLPRARAAGGAAVAQARPRGGLGAPAVSAARHPWRRRPRPASA